MWYHGEMCELEMVTKRIDECSGMVLNYLVALCENSHDDIIVTNGQVSPNGVDYLTPDNVIKTIERENITTSKFNGYVSTNAFGIDFCKPFWVGAIATDYSTDGSFWVKGSTMIEATMRCYVANKFKSMDVEIPKIIWETYLNEQYGKL